MQENSNRVVLWVPGWGHSIGIAAQLLPAALSLPPVECLQSVPLFASIRTHCWASGPLKQHFLFLFSAKVLLRMYDLPSLFCFFHHHSSPMGPINELQRCPSRVWSQGIYPSLPGSRLRIFYRDADSELLHLGNQWLNFSYSRFPLRKSEEKCTSAEI